jgi:glutathione synthase/RimK-type ligase-like ATP-grasp enzyme
MTSVPQ